MRQDRGVAYRKVWRIMNKDMVVVKLFGEVPVPKGSWKTMVKKLPLCKTCSVGNQLRAFLIPDNKVKRYAKLLNKMAKLSFKKATPWEGAVALNITFYMPRPKSCPKTRLYPEVRPDVDKLERCVLDALTGVLYADDGQVTDLQSRKRYSEKVGIVIEATRLGQGDLYE